VRSTQTALTSASATAEIVDDALGALNAIPFVNLSAYNPEVPLSVAIEQVNTSLDPIPTTLGAIADDMETTADSLEQVNTNLARAAQSVKDLSGNVADAATVVAQYQEVVGTLQAEIERLQSRAPDWIGALRWLAAIILIWLAVTQLALLAYGLDLLGRNRRG
jgi:methyl-accepting chemotaxis protein